MSRFGAFQFYGNGRGGAFGGAAVRMAERAGQTPSLEIFANNRDIHLPVSLRRQDRRPRLFPEDHVGRFEPGPAWRSPCATVQCQQGWNLMGADERGCSGTCEGEPQVCCEAVMTAPCLPCAADQVLPVLQRHEHQRLHGHLGRHQQGRCATCKGEFGAPASERRAPATRRSGKGTDGASSARAPTTGTAGAATRAAGHPRSSTADQWLQQPGPKHGRPLARHHQQIRTKDNEVEGSRDAISYLAESQCKEIGGNTTHQAAGTRCSCTAHRSRSRSPASSARPRSEREHVLPRAGSCAPATTWAVDRARRRAWRAWCLTSRAPPRRPPAPSRSRTSTRTSCASKRKYLLV